MVGCKPHEVGGGRVEATPDGVRLILPLASAAQYSDAQLDDLAGVRRAHYVHQPPLRLSLRARFSHSRSDAALNANRPPFAPGRAHSSLRGTAGFGFWNGPYGATTFVPALPRAIWFFYASPPSNLALAIDVPGCGWKATCLDAGRVSALGWVPVAPVVMLLCRTPKLYRSIWPRVQRSLGISEERLDINMTEWHTYELEWRRDGARWRVDGEAILETDRSPRGPLGFIAWIDNRSAIVTPQGRIGFGLLEATTEQWLELAEVNLTRDG